jgi:hypothetical protein
MGNDGGAEDAPSFCWAEPGVKCWATPNLPFLLSQPISSGSRSLTSAHETWISSNPRSFTPLAQTTAKASPIRLNGIKAVPILVSFPTDCFFLDDLDLMERTTDSVSISPKGSNKFIKASDVVRFGCDDSEYLSRTVVSSGPATS